MKFEELIILLPCHSLEDFPLHYEGDNATGLLAAWTALWHPAFIHSAGKTPTWYRADGPPEELRGRLLLIPEVSESLILTGWPARANNEGACVVRKLTHRSEMLESALAELDPLPQAVEPDLVADFLALGLCYLQVELLTRQMRYMSSLDEVHLQTEVVDAAKAAVQGDGVTARERLRNCFDVLTEARERFYPVDAYLIDLVMTVPASSVAALERELAARGPLSLLATGEVIEQLAEQSPATLASLQAAIAERRACLIGGEFIERELPLLPIETILAELARGAAAYQRRLGSLPHIYGRRRFGLSPVLPQILLRSGFTGALHVTLEDGQFPKGEQSKTRWEGLDSTAIDALTRLPLDASKAESLLAFSGKMSESMDLDHVATIVFARWPGQSNPFFDDLRRISNYAPVLGKFVTIGDYFSQTEAPGRITKFDAERYRAPYLKQAIIRRQTDPLSGLAELHRRQAIAECCQTLATIVSLLGGAAQESATAELLTETHASNETNAADSGDLDDRLTKSLRQQTERFAEWLPRQEGPPARGYLVVNTLSFPRRVGLEVDQLDTLPRLDDSVRAVQETGGKRWALVEVPPMGFAWVSGGPASTAKPKGKAPPPMADGTTLRNERVEVLIHPETGGIRAIHVPDYRGNRLSQQLAFRLPTPRPQPGEIWRDADEEARYTNMVAEGIEITSAGPALGEIVSRGRLVDEEGNRLAGFTQRVQLWRESQVVLLDVELDVAEEPRADPWNSYYAARFAWSDPGAEVWRSVSSSGQRSEGKRLEAPQFIEVREEQARTAILSGGLPYHRRMGMRMLDTLLVVRGERARKFRLGIGVDLAHPLHAAMELLTPVAAMAELSTPPKPSAVGWLFHVDAKNVVATHWEPLIESGQVTGFRVRLLETEGRAGRVTLRAFRAVARARQTDFLGQTLADLPVDGDRVRLDCTAHEWVQIEAKWNLGGP